MKAALGSHFLPFLALLMFLALTVGGAYLPLGPMNLPLALTIGIAKTLVVALFFMELRKADTLLRLVACVGLVWLMIFLMLALTDYFTRFPGSLM